MIATLWATAVITVAPAGPVSRVSEAVRLARPGDTVLVTAGHYRETSAVRIDKRLTLVGRDWPVVEGRGDHGILLVVADSVTITGLVVRRVDPSGTEDRAAIRIESGRDCLIAGNRIEDTFFGVYGARADGAVVRDNVIAGLRGSEQAGGNAIQFWSTRAVTISGNVVTGHRDGIYLEFVTASSLRGNESRDNQRYGLHFMFSDSCDYRANRFTGNGAGVAVMYSKQVRMLDNEFSGHRGTASYGLLLKDIVDGDIGGNLFESNTTALYLEGSNRLAIRDNRFLANGWALRLLANSLDNRFSGNTFVGNAFDVTTNSRTASSTFDGNYWDRYRGFDLDHDGRGDVPFRPMRLFSLVVEQNPPALILLRSLFVDLLDVAERVLPVLTPEAMKDPAPLMERPR